jgi:hypothetical protein
LQNYDDLYADIKLWVEKGWIDYNMPQLYWEIGHNAADYTTLLNWWNDNNFGQHLYIGQDIKRSMDRNELNIKINQTREKPFVHGNSYWYGYQITDNSDGAADIIKSEIHRYKALIPAYTHMYSDKPKRVNKLKEVYTEDLHFIAWEHNRDFTNPETAHKFVVYRFQESEKVDVNSAENIVQVTPDNFFLLPYERGQNKYTYVITTLDAFGNESKARKIKVKQ